MTPKENLERIGLMTTKRNLQDFPIGNQPKQFIKMKIKEMPEFQEVVNAITELEELKRDVKRFMEIANDCVVIDGCIREYIDLRRKLLEVGKEE